MFKFVLDSRGFYEKFRILTFYKERFTSIHHSHYFSGIAVVFSIISPMVISFTVDSVIGNEPMDLPGWLMKLVSDFGGRDALRKISGYWV